MRPVLHDKSDGEKTMTENTLYMQLKAIEAQLAETRKALKMLYQWVQAEVEQFEAAAPDDFIIEAVEAAIKKAEEVAE